MIISNYTKLTSFIQKWNIFKWYLVKIVFADGKPLRWLSMIYNDNEAAAVINIFWVETLIEILKVDV